MEEWNAASKSGWRVKASYPVRGTEAMDFLHHLAQQDAARYSASCLARALLTSKCLS